MAKSEVREQAAPTQPEKATEVRHGGGRDQLSGGADHQDRRPGRGSGDPRSGRRAAPWPTSAGWGWRSWSWSPRSCSTSICHLAGCRRVSDPGHVVPHRVPDRPVLYTMSTAFTNFGDAHRSSKQDAISAIEGTSVQQVPGTPRYVLSLATEETRQQGTSSSCSPTRPPSSRSLVPRRGAGLAADDIKWGQTARSWKRRATPSSTSARRVPVPRTSRSSACRPTGAPSRTRGCPGPSRGPPCGPMTRAATASRTPSPARPGPRTTPTACSSTAKGRLWPRAGRSTSASATSPTSSATRPCGPRS